MTNPIDDGGPAFPTPRYARGDMYSTGMSLRDYFAGQALKGFLANPRLRTELNFDAISKEAYRQADEMLRARVHE